MSGSNADWSEMWVWRAPARRAETARMAILTADHLFITGPLDRRRIADLHEAAHLGSERIDAVMQATDSADDSLKLPRKTISAVSWHRSTRVIEIDRVGLEPVRLHCAESESTEEIGRGLQRGLAPSQLPTSVPVPRREMITFELTKGKGRVPLMVLVAGLVAAVAFFALTLYWLGVLASGVVAVALVAVASVIRDADHSVPYYRVELEPDGPEHDDGQQEPDDDDRSRRNGGHGVAGEGRGDSGDEVIDISEGHEPDEVDVTDGVEIGGADDEASEELR